MRECKEQLRLRFEAETDIVLRSCLEDYKKYAEWLEKLTIKQINCELEKENNFLRKRMEKAMDMMISESIRIIRFCLSWYPAHIVRHRIFYLPRSHK